MDKYKETSETWNNMATLYQDKFMDLDLYDETYEVICNSIEKQSPKLLEIGCGPGNITRYLLGKRPDFDILGIDIAPNMVALAQKNNPNARFVVMDGRDVHSFTTRFDGIVCGFCIPFFSQTDTKKFISDCSNLLVEKGIIYISFMDAHPDRSGYKEGSSGDRVYFYFHQLNDLRKLLNDHGFAEMKTFQVAYENTGSEMDIHTILIARKNSDIPSPSLHVPIAKP